MEIGTIIAAAIIFLETDQELQKVAYNEESIMEDY